MLLKEFGIGIRRERCINKSIGINLRKSYPKGLSKKQALKARKIMQEYKLGDSLRKKIRKTSEYLTNTIKSYRGLRNKNGLPSRGQRTKTNAKTKKRISKKIYSGETY